MNNKSFANHWNDTSVTECCQQYYKYINSVKVEFGTSTPAIFGHSLNLKSLLLFAFPFLTKLKYNVGKAGPHLVDNKAQLGLYFVCVSVCVEWYVRPSQYTRCYKFSPFPMLCNICVRTMNVDLPAMTRTSKTTQWLFFWSLYDQISLKLVWCVYKLRVYKLRVYNFVKYYMKIPMEREVRQQSHYYYYFKGNGRDKSVKLFIRA